MKFVGYKVARSDGVTYPSIAAAARANRIAETTMKRYLRNRKEDACRAASVVA